MTLLSIDLAPLTRTDRIFIIFPLRCGLQLNMIIQMFIYFQVNFKTNHK